MLPAALVFVDVPQYGLQLLDETLDPHKYRKVLVVDAELLNRGNYASRQFAGYDLVVPTRLQSESELLRAYREIAASYGVVAVIGFSEMSVLPAAVLAEAFGVRGIGTETARACRNKWNMMEILAHKGVACPPSFLVRSVDDVDSQVVNLGGYPVVCKPLLGFASFGVIRAETKSDLIDAVRRIRRSTRFLMGRYYGLDSSCTETDILVQSYIPGIEVAVDGYVQDGKSHVWAIIDKPDVSQGPYFADAMHITPTALDTDTARKIEETVQAAVVAVGLDHSPFHVEARIHEGKCYILELAARVAFVRVLRDARGIDPMEAMIALRLGNTPEAPPSRNRYSGGYCMTPHESGVFSHIANLEQVRQTPGISEIAVYISEGTRVAPAPESTGDVAHVRACADTYDDVLDALALAKRELRVVVR